MNTEQFTDRSKRVMQLANQEAQRYNHEYIDTEHILLGLVKEGGGLGCTTLKELGVDLRKVRLEVEKLLMTGPEMVTMGKLPQTGRAKKVIECAFNWRANLGHSAIGTEHLLLGLESEPEGIAGQVLRSLGVTTEGILAVLDRIFTGNQMTVETIRITFQDKVEHPMIDKPGTVLPEGYYWKELSNGTVTVIQAVGSGCFSEQARYIRAIPPTFPPRIPAKIDTVLYRLKRDYVLNAQETAKAGYLFWGVESQQPRKVYDSVTGGYFMWEDIEEVQ